MFDFLFKSKKGSMKGGAGAGGFCVIGLIVFAICIWPYVKGHFSFNTPDLSGVPFIGDTTSVSETTESTDSASTSETSEATDSSNTSEEATESENNTSADNNLSVNEVYTFVLDTEKAKEMASKITIAEADTEHDSARSDWETKQKFTTPISNKKRGIKDYAYELETGLAYDREDFVFYCPYTNKEVTDVTKIDYDHIIPLNYVDSHGGYAWDKEKKQEYAYNTNNGVCTAQGPNRAKSDKGPSKYMPEINKEWYCYRWLEIATNYDISLSQADYDVIVSTLGI